MDPSGGAGLLRDAAVLGSLGVHTMAITLAETIQNGLACVRILPPAVSPVERLEALAPHLSDPWGLKLSMCALELNVLEHLLDRLNTLHPSVNIWDPILGPSLGASLHDEKRLRAMAECILSKGSWIVSPNLPEASALSGLSLVSNAHPDLTALAKPLLDLGAKAVWLKGGHGEGTWVEDFWIDGTGTQSLGRHRRLEGQRRGTGCFLSATWLGLRLLGNNEIKAAKVAGNLLRKAWKHPILPGGIGRPCLAPEAR
jgi:hydroxymethylpyrimidine/phosphomethylpyrimidine kinase